MLYNDESAKVTLSMQLRDWGDCVWSRPMRWWIGFHGRRARVPAASARWLIAGLPADVSCSQPGRPVVDRYLMVPTGSVCSFVHPIHSILRQVTRPQCHLMEFPAGAPSIDDGGRRWSPRTTHKASASVCVVGSSTLNPGRVHLTAAAAGHVLYLFIACPEPS